MNELTNPEGEVRVSPEALEIATTYLECADIGVTAEILGVDREKVSYFLNKKEVKRFVDSVFLDQGYLNRHKLQESMSNIIQMKMDELLEAEIGSTKDIADLLMMAHKMRTDNAKMALEENKEAGPSVVVNQNGGGMFGNNYDSLMSKLSGSE